METTKVIHLREYLKVLRKRKYIVLTCFIIVFGVVLIQTFSAQPVYMALTKVLIEKVAQPVLPGSYSSDYSDPDFYETQFQLIRSTAVSKKVVDLLYLDKTYDNYFKDKTQNYSFIGAAVDGFRDIALRLLTTKGAAEIRGKDDEGAVKANMIAKIISGGVVVKPVKNSKIVQIGYMSSNPEFAKNVTDTIAKAYIETLLDLNMSQSRFNLQWMTTKAEEEKEKLEKSEKALQEFVQKNNFVTVEDKMTLLPQQMSELNAQLIQAETKEKETETLYNKVQQLSGNLDKAETLSVVASDPGVISLHDQIQKAEQQVIELSQKYGKKHPLIVRAVEEVKALKAKRAMEIKRVVRTLTNDYELIRANTANLSRMVEQKKAETLGLNEKYEEYGMLNREVEANRQIYDALIKKIGEQSITEEVRTVNVMVLEPAEMPKSPVSPNKPHNLLVGLLVGLMSGIGMAFFVEYLDNRVKNPEEVEAKFGTSVLGIIPLHDTPGSHIDTMVLREPTSTLAENYKAIRTSLLLSSAERPPRCVLVTSTGPGEGKSTTTANLAVAIAQSDYKVLLIDADLRRPRIHKIFGLNNAKGLSTFLAGASDVDAIQEGPLPNLNIITSGPIPPNPSELLGSQRMTDVLTELSDQSKDTAMNNLLNELGDQSKDTRANIFSNIEKKYDIIIIDSPPLLTVTDSLILSRITDGTILVTSADKTTYDDLGKGLKTLAGMNAYVIGVVMNLIDLKKADYYYYRYLGYYYSSSYTAKDEVKSNVVKANVRSKRR